MRASINATIELVQFILETNGKNAQGNFDYFYETSPCFSLLSLKSRSRLLPDSVAGILLPWRS